MATIISLENLTVRQFCNTLDAVTESEATTTTQAHPLSTASSNQSEVDDNADTGVVVIPYVVIATTLIVVLIVDFTRYRRNNAYKYRRKQEKREHNINRHFRKVRGAPPVPMDPEHLALFQGSEPSSATAVEDSHVSAHDQGYAYADDDVGGLSAAVSAENSKAIKTNYAASPMEAENGMAAWQLKFGRDASKAKFMNVSCSNNKKDVV